MLDPHAARSVSTQPNLDAVLRAARGRLSAQPSTGVASRARARLHGQPGDPRVLAYALGYDVECDPQAAGGEVRESKDPSFAKVIAYPWSPSQREREQAVLHGIARALLGPTARPRRVAALAEGLAAMV